MKVWNSLEATSQRKIPDQALEITRIVPMMHTKHSRRR